MMTPKLSYGAVGATGPADEIWSQPPQGYRRYERTVRLAQGQEHWDAAASAVMAWGVKTRSGFEVESVLVGDERVRLGADYWLTAALGPFTLRSLTRPGRGRWRLAFPGVLVAQRWYRSRYLRALHGLDLPGGP
jgi:uncharacterized protein (UPF0548 family)